MSHLKVQLALLLLPAVIFAPIACSRSSNDFQGRKAIAAAYPPVDGSTSTHPLSMLLACKISGISYEWKIPPASERTVFPSHRDHPLKATIIQDKIKHYGTHEAYMNLVKKKADLILVARGPSERESQAAQKLGVSFDVKPIALDALVFVVNIKNPINSLTLSQIRAIYSPDGTKAWRDVGGQDTPIEAFQREQDSGSQELMHKLVMKGIPIGTPKQMPIVYTMAGAVHAASHYENGIAFSVYYYITNMAPNRAVKLIAINGVKPSSQTIATSEYPLIAEVFAVMRMNTKKENTARLLRDWLETDQGRDAIQESGYVPISEKYQSTN